MIRKILILAMIALFVIILGGCDTHFPQRALESQNIFFRMIGQMWEWTQHTYDQHPVLGILAGILTILAAPPLAALGLIWWILQILYGWIVSLIGFVADPSGTFYC